VHEQALLGAESSETPLAREDIEEEEHKTVSSALIFAIYNDFGYNWDTYQSG
jgi:hypothetical protein